MPNFIEARGRAAPTALLISLVGALALSACAEGTTSSYTQGPIGFNGEGAAVLAEPGSFEAGVPSYVSVAGNALLPANTATPIVSSVLAADGGAPGVGTSAAALGQAANAGAVLGSSPPSYVTSRSVALASIPASAELNAGANALGAKGSVGAVGVAVALTPNAPSLTAQLGPVAATASAASASPSLTAQIGPTTVAASVSPSAPGAVVQAVTGGAGIGAAITTPASAVPVTAAAVTPSVTLSTQGSVLGAVSGLTSTGNGSQSGGSNPLVIVGALTNKKSCNPLLMRC